MTAAAPMLRGLAYATGGAHPIEDLPSAKARCPSPSPRCEAAGWTPIARRRRPGRHVRAEHRRNARRGRAEPRADRRDRLRQFERRLGRGGQDGDELRVSRGRFRDDDDRWYHAAGMQHVVDRLARRREPDRGGSGAPRTCSSCSPAACAPRRAAFRRAARPCSATAPRRASSRPSTATSPSSPATRDRTRFSPRRSIRVRRSSGATSKRDFATSRRSLGARSRKPARIRRRRARPVRHQRQRSLS